MAQTVNTDAQSSAATVKVQRMRAAAWNISELQIGAEQSVIRRRKGNQSALPKCRSRSRARTATSRATGTSPEARQEVEHSGSATWRADLVVAGLERLPSGTFYNGTFGGYEWRFASEGEEEEEE